MKTTINQRLGVMFGLAYGDALGRPTEFMNGEKLKKLGTPFRKAVGINHPRQGIATDDTQMSIAVAAAALGEHDPNILTDRFIREFVRWQLDPASTDGRRSPGTTCMSAVSALRRIEQPSQWITTTRPDSKGNGANMRVAPLALRTDWTWKQLAEAAQLQAAITHGHPTALAAADLTAFAVRLLLEGVSKPGEPFLDHLLAYANEQRSVYHGAVLGQLWQGFGTQLPPWTSSQPTLPKAALKPQWWEDADGLTPAYAPARPRVKAPGSPQEFIEHGWDEMIDALLRIYGKHRDPKQDPCEVAGGGWIAEEALAGAVHTLLCFPDNPTDALRRAAFTDGDSDSIATIAGALEGAAHGRSAFPSHWIGNLEYRFEMEALTVKLTAAAGC